MSQALVLEPGQIDAYLQRLAYEGSTTVTIQTLRRLQLAHLRSVPFENLDIHLGREILLKPGDLFDKVVGNRRGGFCYELNGLFAALLQALGFGVDLLSARVFGGDPIEPGPEYDHMTLLVTVGDEQRLVDVGFGESFQQPLKLLAGIEQAQPRGRYRLSEAAGEWTLAEKTEMPADGSAEKHVVGEEDWRPSYVFSLIPRQLEEFAGMCRFHQTSEKSHFTRSRICTLATAGGRITLSGMRFKEMADGRRTEREMSGESEFWAVALERFGVTAEN